MHKYIILNAGNDVNGNPRRVYVVFNQDDMMIDAVDDGYAGISAIETYRPAIHLGTFDTSVKQYKQLLKEFRK